MKKHFLLFLFIAALLSFSGAAFAQDVPALSETFTTADGSFSVRHPEGWVGGVDGSFILVGTSQAILDEESDKIPAGEIRVGFGLPADVANNLGLPADADTKIAAETIASRFLTSNDTPGAPINFKVGGLPATRIIAQGPDAQALVMVIQVESGFLMIIAQTAPNEMNSQLPLILAIAESITLGEAGAAGGAAEGDLVRQWASTATGSSQYGTTSWSFSQATGEPDTPQCGDYGTAWASESSRGKDTLTLGFDQIVIPTQINIHQTYNPGSITKVEVVGADGSVTELLKSADPVGNTSCPGVFTINIAQELPPVVALTIHLDQTIGGSWNEIDAVELVGTAVSGDIVVQPPATAVPQFSGPVTGVAVQCPNGLSFTNGVEVIVNMRSGFTYTATAVGVDGFDPIIAVRDTGGTTLCNDDSSAAASYSADLPTSGFVSESNLSAQMPFNHSYSGFADISIIVGSPDSGAGEFLLIIEGLAVTSADGSGEGAGDPFTVYFSPNVLAAETPVSVYMISVTSALDPLMNVMNADNRVFQFDNGDLWACDDAGTPGLCWGEDDPLLVGSYVSRTRGRQLPGGTLDAMMTIPKDMPGLGEGYITWRMTSSGQRSFGDYIVVFHMGTAATNAGV